MSEIGEYFKDLKEHYRDKKQDTYEKRMEFLKKSDMDYQIMNESCGHVRISTDVCKYDVWLSTGKWTKVGSQQYHQDWNKLLKAIKKANKRV